MSNNSTSQDNGFMSGFILGVIVGAVGIFLLGTKRGKKLLKILSEEGLEGMSELEELLTEKVIDEKPVVIKKKIVKPQIEKKEEIVEAAVAEKNPPQPALEQKPVETYVPRALGRIQTSGRRFFKGIPKKTS